MASAEPFQNPGGIAKCFKTTYRTTENDLYMTEYYNHVIYGFFLHE